MSILTCKIILVELALPCLAGLASITESHPADLISRSQQRVVGCQETAKKNRWGCDCQGNFVFFSNSGWVCTRNIKTSVWNLIHWTCVGNMSSIWWVWIILAASEAFPIPRQVWCYGKDVMLTLIFDEVIIHNHNESCNIPIPSVNPFELYGLSDRS